MANGAVYWLGADGNIYLKSADQGGSWSVKNVGQPWNANSLQDGGFDSRTMSAQAQRIADPNPPSQAAAAPASPNGGGGGGSAAPAKPDKSNDIALQNAGLAAVDSQLATGLSSIDKSLATILGRYNEDAANSDAQYTDSSNTNTGNLQKNKQSAFVNAAAGRQGLFGSLASIGALNGSGIDLANRAVTKGANVDLAGAQDTFDTNKTTLDNNIAAFRKENDRRKEDANTNAENARLNAKNSAAKARFQYFGNLANDYADQGDEAQAKDYTAKASALYPELSKTSIPNANLSYSGVAYTPGELGNYLAGEGSTVVQTTPTQPGQTIPGLVASPTRKDKEKQLA